jgi:hypothetical protein
MGDYVFFVGRQEGGSARVTTTNASPVTVLMSWCKLTSLTPVISWTSACKSGFAVSIRWVRTCLSKSERTAGNDPSHCRADTHTYRMSSFRTGDRVTIFFGQIGFLIATVMTSEAHPPRRLVQHDRPDVPVRGARVWQAMEPV